MAVFRARSPVGRLWSRLALLSLVAFPAPAHADYVPLQRTPAGVAARVDEALDRLGDVGPVVGVAPAQVRAAEGCRHGGSEIESGDVAWLSRCIEALGAVYGALTSKAETDAVRAGARTYLASEVADAALRVTSARAAAVAGDPGALAPAPGVAAQVLVLADLETLRIRPVQALRPGRKFALVIDGLTPEELDAVRASVVPRPSPTGLDVPPGSFVDPIVDAMGRDPSGMDHEMAHAVARQIEDDVRGRAATSPVAGVQVALPAPLRPDDLGRIVARFVPHREAPRDSTVVTLPIADLRGDLAPALERLAELPCATSPSVPRAGRVGGGASSAVSVFAGEYPSVEIRREEGGRLYETPVRDAGVVDLPYLLAVPDGIGPETPLVVLVHGHGGSAEKFLAHHGAALVSRGLAVVAVEIPDHGIRGSREKHFLGIRDPSRFRVNVRQSLLDILALIQAATHCGFVLPGGETYRPTDVRYMGYSFGGLLGITVRSVWPGLGRAVFLAAAGDLAGWLRLHFAIDLNAPVVTCVGGAQNGRDCLQDRKCAPPGVCWVDPYLVQMASLIDLPFGLALAEAEPLGPARVRTGASSDAPLLLLTGGSDGVLFPLLQARLGDAYDLRGEHPGRIRGPSSERRHWPELGHDLIDNDEVRSTAYDFLAAESRTSASSQANPSVDNHRSGR